MNISIKKLIINNFKGIRNLEINFNHTTEISGKNEAGKSTIFDAFCFVNWQKNSENKTDFNIKNTVDLSLNKLDHSVKEILEVDGVETSFTTIYRETWTTRRGESVKVMTGHEFEYQVNDVPKSKKEYSDKINSIIPEAIAKLITNPFAFNGLKWEERRKVLVNIAGNPSDADIAHGDANFEALLYMLNGKTPEDFKKETAVKKKRIRETLELIPARIDESSRSKPTDKDFPFIEKSIENKRKLIEKVELAITDKVNTHRLESVKIIQKQNDLNRLKMQLQELEAAEKRNAQKGVIEVDNQINTFEASIKSHKSTVSRSNTEIAFLKTKIDKLENETKEVRIKWHAINKEVLPPMEENATTCPACSQSLPVDRIEAIKAEYETKWNADKLKRMAALKGQGDANNTSVNSFRVEISEYDLAVSNAETNISALEFKVNHLKETKAELLKPKQQSEPVAITALKKQIEDFDKIEPPVIDDKELKARKAELQSEIDSLKLLYGKKEQIEKIELRIKELETQERELAQQIADLERTEFTIDGFTRAKMDMVETRVNGMFSTLINFKMFSQNINGGFEACCDCFYKGVPWPDVNTAGKIQCGLSLIGVLSGHYTTFAPIWIDNRESCAEIPAMLSQTINLYHVPGKELTIN